MIVAKVIAHVATAGNRLGKGNTGAWIASLAREVEPASSVAVDAGGYRRNSPALRTDIAGLQIVAILRRSRRVAVARA